MSTEAAKKRRYEGNQQHRKRIQMIHDLQIDFRWGKYSIDFDTHNQSHSKEMLDFLHSIEQHASWPLTYRSALVEIVTKLSKLSGKSQVITAIPQALDSLPQPPDIILIDDPAELDEVLSQPFARPLFYCASLATKKLHTREHLSVHEFINYLQQSGTREMDVYDYTIHEPSDRTRSMSMDNVAAYFQTPSDRRTALNFLDIENRRGDYCPTQIVLHNLLSSISSMEATKVNDKGVAKTNSSWSETRREFFLLSGKNAVSTIHVDTAGQLTWITILAGRKIWYFPRCISPDESLLLGLMGSQSPSGYTGGWVKVELKPGDVLVMPPGCPHAVFSPEDTLAVGGNFYTAAHFGSSLWSLWSQEMYPDTFSNEDINLNDYADLTKIINHATELMSEAQRANVASKATLWNAQSLPAGVSPELTVFLNNLSKRTRDPKQKKACQRFLQQLGSAHGTSELVEARATFLARLHTFQQAYVASQDLEES